MRYGSVAAMVAWLDREERERSRERRMRKILRKLPRKMRTFALTLKRVLVRVPGPEDLQAEKIMKALKIGDRMYRKYLAAVPKNIV